MVMFHSYVMLVYQRVAPNHPVVMKDHELYWNLWWRLGIPHFLETPIEVLRVKLYTEPLIFPHRPGIPNHLATWRRSWRNNHWHLIKSISKHRYPANTPLSLSWWIFIFHEKSPKKSANCSPWTGYELGIMCQFLNVNATIFCRVISVLNSYPYAPCMVYLPTWLGDF